MADTFKDFSNIKILCIGDIMLDKFVYGNVNRISPEAPVQILNLKETKEMLGGCGNVVANLATLGCKTEYIGIVGKDENGEKIAKLLKDVGCHFHLLKLTDYKTIVKTRFIAGNNHILRLDEEEKLPLAEELLPKYEIILDMAIKNVDIVLLSDYDKGIFSPVITQLIIKICHKYNKTIVVDPKGRDYTKYSGATFVKPNLKEFQEAIGIDINPLDKNFKEKIIKGAKYLFNKCNINNLIVTMSEYGMLCVSSNNPDEITIIPTVAKDVYDVSGAGDTTVAVFTIAIAMGLTTIDAMKLANTAAGSVVGKVGIACVTANELKNTINLEKKHKHSHLSKIMNIQDASFFINDLKNKNNVIGFTNGCFDIIHLGHLYSLAEAKKNCDILVVGINSDNSVKKLKGQNRPLQDEKTRSNIVAAIEYVDCVVIFDDETALPIIKTLKPNVIIKEGYTIDKWPEAQFVESYGGKAITLSRLDGFSTTEFLNQLKDKIEK